MGRTRKFADKSRSNRIGGLARAKALTPERRREIAIAAAAARINPGRKKAASVSQAPSAGTIAIGPMEYERIGNKDALEKIERRVARLHFLEFGGYRYAVIAGSEEESVAAIQSALISQHIDADLHAYMRGDPSIAGDAMPVDKKSGLRSAQLKRSVEDLGLSVRAYHGMQAAGIRSIGELVQKSETEMLRTKNLGRKTLDEIQKILSRMGLAFGMSPDATQGAGNEAQV